MSYFMKWVQSLEDFLIQNEMLRYLVFDSLLNYFVILHKIFVYGVVKLVCSTSQENTDVNSIIVADNNVRFTVAIDIGHY